MHSKLLSLSLLACGVGLVACGKTAPTPPPPAVVDLLSQAPAAAEAIDEGKLLQRVADLADDAMAGRGPGSAGDAAARSYLIDQMKALGLEPGGPKGSWEQPFGMVGITSEVPKEWNFSRAGKTTEFKYWDDFIAASGVQAEEATVSEAEVVFVGYGIQAPEYEWDDFAGVDLSGKVLLILNNDPDWDPELFEGNRRLYYGRWTYKYEAAAAQGAAGAIIIHTTPSAGYGWQVIQSSWTGEQFELPTEGEPRIQVAGWLTEDASKKLVALGGQDLDSLREMAKERSFQPIPLGVTTSLAVTNKVRRVETANVLGLLRGRDAELSDEVVIYSAHFDHLGQREAGDDPTADTIYNGALDNATGCSQLLAMASSFAALSDAPRRSVLFAFVGAEEQGLLGSKYYALHPTFPPGKMAAVLNYDGGNIWGRTRDMTFVGMEKSNLGDLITELAEEQGRVVNPDQFPDQGSYYRSDQFSFAKIGVPGVYLDGGLDFLDHPAGWGREQVEAWLDEHYHQVSDELNDTWVFDGMVEDARLGFLAGLRLAEADEFPKWTPGDEFEAIRLEALAAVADEAPEATH
ncbi:MAG: M28 family peptidase [Thermoanaerobaculia bacterium]|nr:M28 family peptidase [Thermoanaerobaculia bacterium]